MSITLKSIINASTSVVCPDLEVRKTLTMLIDAVDGETETGSVVCINSDQFLYFLRSVQKNGDPTVVTLPKGYPAGAWLNVNAGSDLVGILILGDFAVDKPKLTQVYFYKNGYVIYDSRVIDRDNVMDMPIDSYFLNGRVYRNKVKRHLLIVDEMKKLKPSQIKDYIFTVDVTGSLELTPYRSIVFGKMTNVTKLPKTTESPKSPVPVKTEPTTVKAKGDIKINEFLESLILLSMKELTPGSNKVLLTRIDPGNFVNLMYPLYTLTAARSNIKSSVENINMTFLHSVSLSLVGVLVIEDKSTGAVSSAFLHADGMIVVENKSRIRTRATSIATIASKQTDMLKVISRVDGFDLNNVYVCNNEGDPNPGYIGHVFNEMKVKADTKVEARVTGESEVRIDTSQWGKITGTVKAVNVNQTILDKVSNMEKSILSALDGVNNTVSTLDTKITNLDASRRLDFLAIHGAIVTRQQTPMSQYATQPPTQSPPMYPQSTHPQMQQPSVYPQMQYGYSPQGMSPQPPMGQNMQPNNPSQQETDVKLLQDEIKKLKHTINDYDRVLGSMCRSLDNLELKMESIGKVFTE